MILKLENSLTLVGKEPEDWSVSFGLLKFTNLYKKKIIPPYIKHHIYQIRINEKDDIYIPCMEYSTPMGPR